MKYELNNLKVTVTGNPDLYNCSHTAGQGIVVKGENFEFLEGTSSFSHYAMSALVPFLAAKQRATDNNDWMTYEEEIACPDRKCGAIFRIERTGVEVFEYGDE